LLGLCWERVRTSSKIERGTGKSRNARVEWRDERSEVTDAHCDLDVGGCEGVEDVDSMSGLGLMFGLGCEVAHSGVAHC
jgi:hypothetical protein